MYVSPNERADHDGEDELHRLERRKHEVWLAEPKHVLLHLSQGWS